MRASIPFSAVPTTQSESSDAIMRVSAARMKELSSTIRTFFGAREVERFMREQARERLCGTSAIGQWT
jgi:hypothetical protein